MDDQHRRDIERRLKILELSWKSIDRLRNVFAVTPNANDVIKYNKPLAQWEAGPAVAVLPPGTLFNLNRIFYFPSDPSYPTQWTKTAANLQPALAACGSGEIVQVHGPCTLAGDFTVPAGGILIALHRHNIVLQGTVYLEDGAAIWQCGIEKTANDATNIYGVVGPTTGTAYVLGCDVTVSQAEQAMPMQLEQPGEWR